MRGGLAEPMPATHPTNLLAQPTTLVGRTEEVAAAQKLLAQQGLRLLTLTGPGGIGKTRLGLELGAELREVFEDGVFAVSLAPIIDPEALPATIAHAIGLRDAGGRPPRELLRDYLHRRRMLLILDNFERILRAAPVVAELLASSPRLSILVTSRAPLRLMGEHEFAVPPLELPNDGQTSAAALSAYGAVALFAERAGSVRTDFTLTDENASIVAEICRRVDGLPLGIELAAARVRVLSPGAILARLERCLPLLTGGARDLPSRQRTLRDTIAWSYDLLQPHEKVLFQHMSVFVGGCTLDALGTVGGFAHWSETDVLDGVSSVVAQSLASAVASTAGDPRFDMLQTIREFGREQLVAAGQAAAVAQRHAEFCLASAAHAAPHLRTSQQLDWLARLDSEHDNMRAALMWSVSDVGDPDVGLRLAGALSWFWPLRGHLSEGRHWLEATLERCTIHAPEGERLRALIGSGQYASLQGDHAAAAPRLEQALAGARALGDPHREAYALTFLGFTALQRDADPDLIESLQEASVDLFRTVGDTWGVALASLHLAVAVLIRGNYPRARVLGLASAEVFRTTGDRLGSGLALGWLGHAALRDGDRGAAREHFLESLTALRPLQVHWVIERAYRGLAAVAHQDRDHGRAARLLGAADTSLEAGGTLRGRFEHADYERIVARVRRELGERAFRLTWARGRALTLSEAADAAAAAANVQVPAAGEPVPSSPVARREVAALIARGMTNRQIAAELVIARGTVQRHVANILGKLEVAFRHPGRHVGGRTRPDQGLDT